MYVATTNQAHMEPTLMMLRSGKNVLVEKPTSVTYKEAKVMYDEAKVCLHIAGMDLIRLFYGFLFLLI